MKSTRQIAKTIGCFLGILFAITALHTLVVSFPQPFFKHRLMIAYLVETQGMTFQEIVKHPPEYAEVASDVASLLNENEPIWGIERDLRKDNIACICQ